MRNYLMAALGAAVLLAAPVADASAGDGLNRWVRINNVSGFRTVVTLYAVPSHYQASRISGITPADIALLMVHFEGKARGR